MGNLQEDFRGEPKIFGPCNAHPNLDKWSGPTLIISTLIFHLHYYDCFVYPFVRLIFVEEGENLLPLHSHNVGLVYAKFHENYWKMRILKTAQIIQMQKWVVLLRL